jgi:hypothetical protein
MLVWGSVADRAIENYRALRPGEQTFWLVELLNYEVGNGGFVQYFANTEGAYVDDTVQALRTIGALGQCACSRRPSLAGESNGRRLNRFGRRSGASSASMSCQD